jgi:hypothetical protein
MENSTDLSYLTVDVTETAGVGREDQFELTGYAMIAQRTGNKTWQFFPLLKEGS